MPHAYPIKNRLRQYRKSSGLTQKQVARAINLSSPTQVSRWERSERLPNLVQALRLSALYQRLVNDLFFGLFQEQREIVIERKKTME